VPSGHRQQRQGQCHGDASWPSRGVVTVVSVTSKADKIYPFQVLLSASTSGLAVESKAQAEQVRSIATQRLSRGTGRVCQAELADLDDALRLHLAL